jgi:hypothetical protein
MYRIKTDIRQFKCDTREKVEKLIRNWVIRPTDLLYHRDQKRWAPIGDSEEFEPIFQQIKDSSEDDEETVVTAREDSPAALIDATEQEPEEEDADDADSSTRARPSAAVLRPSKNVVRKSAPEPLPIPEAPAGVEEAVVDHEVTVMTERTADLLGLRDSDDIQMSPQEDDGDDEATLADDSEPQLSRSDLPEELFLTNELSAPEPISTPDDSVLDELGDASSVDDAWGDLEGLDENSAFSDDEDERATVELDVADIKLEDRRRRRAQAQEQEDEEVTAITRAPASDRPRRRTAPKEPSSTVFVDASYGSDEPDALQDEPLLDEPLLEDLPRSASSGEYDDLPAPVTAPADPYADLPAPASATKTDPYADLPAPASASKSDPYDDLPAPVASAAAPALDDLPAPVASPAPADPQPAEFDDLPAPVDAREPAEEHASEPEPEPAPDAPTSEPSLEAASEPDPFAPALDDDLEDLPELDVIEPVDDDAFEDLLEVEEVKPFVQDRDFVSEGYKLELPFTVAPTPEDVAAGVKRSTATLAQKNKAFPYPRPKKIGEVQLRTYGDTKDYSLYFVIGGVVLLVLVIISAVVIMSP